MGSRIVSTVGKKTLPLFPQNAAKQKPSRFPRASLASACIVAAWAALAPSPRASAATISWTNVGGDSLWSTATNWSPNGTPSSTSSVVIGNPATIATPSQDNTSTTIANLTIAADSGLAVESGIALTLSNGGYINNDGTITINEGGSNVRTGLGIVGSVELAGTGSIVLNANGNATAAALIFDAGSSNLTQDSGHTISGTGEINVDEFTNSGTVNANSSGNTLLLETNSQAYVNNNLIEGTSGGTLEESSTTINNGANGIIEANGGAVLLYGGTISGGTLTSTAGGEIDAENNTNLVNITLSSGSNLQILDGSTAFANNGNNNDLITNDGTITINKGGSNARTGLGIVGSVELAGTGSIVLNANGNATAAALIFDAGSSNLTQDSGHTISGTGEINVNEFTNNGTVNANSSGNTLLLQTNSQAYVNNGTYQASNGGTLAANSLSNISGGFLTGGTYEVDANSTMNLPNGITGNAATIILNGTNTSFAAISGLATNSGTFKLENAATFKTTGNFTNSGTITLDPSSLNVIGNLTLSSSSILDIGAIGAQAGQFSTVDTTGSAELAGSLEVSLENGFTAQVGDTLTFLTAPGGITGAFATTGPFDVNGYVFDLVGTSTTRSLQVEATPEPSAAGILLLGGLGLLLVKRRCPSRA